MQHYDTSVKVEYDTDDDYRKCLLAVFRLKEFGAELIDRIDAIGLETKGVPGLHEKAAQMGVGFESDLAFFMLFSYDAFKETHNTMVKLCAAMRDQGRM
jgi:hypothetical protein